MFKQAFFDQLLKNEEVPRDMPACCISTKRPVWGEKGWDYEVFLCKPRLLTISSRWLLKTDESIRGFTISLSKRRISCSYTFDLKHKTDDCCAAPVLIRMMA